MRSPKNLSLVACLFFGLAFSNNLLAKDESPQQNPVTPQTESAATVVKSKSNITNNREAAEGTSNDPAEPAPESGTEAVIKTKTKSNQSND